MYNHHTELINFFEAIEYGIDTHKNEVIKTSGELKSIKFLRYRNMQDCIYVRPIASRAPFYLLLDDISPDAAKGHRHEPGRLVCETSPGSFQSWIRLDSPLTYDEKMLFIIAADADSDAKPTIDRWGRCPGFINRKPAPKKLGPNGERFWSRLVAMTPGVTETASLSNLISTPQGPVSPATVGGGSGLLPVANDTSYIGSTNKVVTNNNTGRDESCAEFFYACEMIRKGFLSSDQISENVARHALNRGKRKTLAAAQVYARNLIIGALSAVNKSRI